MLALRKRKGFVSDLLCMKSILHSICCNSVRDKQNCLHQMRGENNRRKKKKELIPSHAVISSPSICHTRRSGNPVGLMWHFVIRLIMFPAGSSPSNHPHRHTTPRENASGPCTLFSEFMGQWELDVKDVDKAGPTQQFGGKKEKFKENLPQETDCAVWMLGLGFNYFSFLYWKICK